MPNQYAKFLRYPGNKMSFSKVFIEPQEEKTSQQFSRKKTYTTIDNKGFHIFENNGTSQMNKLRDISSE